MKDAGYQYINVDDCWQAKSRDADGNIQADPEHFPSGIKAPADYVHSKGLKFGLYSDAGSLTCAGRPGSAGHEFQDARQYARWGVDFLKYDWCYTGTRNAEAAYTIMAKALRESGRDIVLSICEWGTDHPERWGPTVGHLWRTTHDIYDGWETTKDRGNGMTNILDMQAARGGQSAPNAFDQDPLGQRGRRALKEGELEVWVRPLAGGEHAVVLFNRGKTPADMKVAWEQLQLPADQKAEVKDLWSKKVSKGVRGSYGGKVAPHGVIMVRITPLR
jgi:alpha-galactosidase